MANRELAEKIVLRLFVNGFRQRAERLVLTAADGRDLGGWCFKAAVDQVEATLNANDVFEQKGRSR